MGAVILIALAAILYPVSGYCKESYLKYGVGVASSKEAHSVGLGHSEPITGAIKSLKFLEYQLETGAWFDSKEGRKSSAYGSASVGPSVHAGPFKASVFHGLGLITTPDALLTGGLHFFHDLSLGLEDGDSKAGISLSYKHISNAGWFSETNNGRDFMTIKLSIPW